MREYPHLSRVSYQFIILKYQDLTLLLQSNLHHGLRCISSFPYYEMYFSRTLTFAFKRHNQKPQNKDNHPPKYPCLDRQIWVKFAKFAIIRNIVFGQLATFFLILLYKNAFFNKNIEKKVGFWPRSPQTRMVKPFARGHFSKKK